MDSPHRHRRSRAEGTNPGITGSRTESGGQPMLTSRRCRPWRALVDRMLTWTSAAGARSDDCARPRQARPGPRASASTNLVTNSWRTGRAVCSITGPDNTGDRDLRPYYGDPRSLPPLGDTGQSRPDISRTVSGRSGRSLVQFRSRCGGVLAGILGPGVTLQTNTPPPPSVCIPTDTTTP